MLEFRLITFATMACAFTIASTPAAAGCWSAVDSGTSGAAVEICLDRNCEGAFLDLECANAGGTILEYSNGWRIEHTFSGTSETTTITLNGRLVGAGELQRLSCRNLDEEGGCRFPSAGPAPLAGNPLDLIEGYFKAALEIDATHIQISLLEAGLYSGVIDGIWGRGTRGAFADALDWANSRGMSYDLSSDEGFYRFVADIRAALYDIDSGLGQTPNGSEYFLVTASRRTSQDAVQVANGLEKRLAQIGFPNRVSVLRATNGWIAVTAGMYSQQGCGEKAALLKSYNLIPQDAYCAEYARFDPFNWVN